MAREGLAPFPFGMRRASSLLLVSDRRRTGGAGLDLESGLELFGLPGFRPGQREAIETLLEHGRLLFVAPTGGGKSLIFQLPAALLPGTTLVVCPLVSLMKDQVASLTRKGIAATYLASTLEPQEQLRRTRELVRGGYKFLYVAPERLSSPRFRELAAEFECPFVAVDESHCISEWGHDFRPEYLRIGEFLRFAHPPRVLAVTATATPGVQDEIVARLGLGADTPRIVRGFGRSNLALHVRRIRDRAERDRLVDETLERALGAGLARGPGSGSGPAGVAPGAGGAAVIYAPTRRMAEEEAVRLAATGRWRCLAYHAGLPNEVRDAAQDAFCSGSIDVVVATNAFGMGIDRPDVRLVIHLGPPGSIESYYQEVGRGGRDGQEAVGVLLLGREEIALRRRFVESAGAGAAPGCGDSGTAPGDGLDPSERRQVLFDELMRWAFGRSCRHEGILAYFGETPSGRGPCGKCDVCGRRAAGAGRRRSRWSVFLRKLARR